MIANWPYIFINGKEIAELKQSGYAKIPVDPGSISLEVKNGGNPLKRFVYYWPGPGVKIEFPVQSQKTYYVRFSPSNEISYPIITYHDYITGVPESIGEAEISKLDFKFQVKSSSENKD